MKRILGLMVVATLLVACERSDEHKEVEKEIKQVYDKASEPKKERIIGDTKAGKEVAKKCASCHGMDGTLAAVGAPFIAGLHQDYLVAAMLSYKDGSRKNDLMKPIATSLSPEDIGNVSAYYATLKTPWKGANVGATKPKSAVSLSSESVAAGAAVAARCNSCHGEKGNSNKDHKVPALAGLTPEYFIPALKSYFNGKRNHDIMKMFGMSLSEQEIKQLAAYYAVQTPQKPPRPDQGNVKAGDDAAAACAGCHNIDGNALNPEIPSLSGQPAEYLVKAIQDYRDGKRKDPLMSGAVRHMSDKTILNVAAHYAVQQPESPLHRAKSSEGKFDPVADGRKIAQSCDGCHGHNGNSEKAGIPSLTGLDVKYIVSASRDYREGVRKNETMKKMVSHLSDTDLEKVGFYYATREPANKKKPPAFDLAAGKKLSENCTACHGEEGVSKDPKTPSLAGQDAEYLAAATRAYASGGRNNENMSGPAKGLKAPQDVVNVTHYFASLKPAKPDVLPPPPPQLSIVEKCNRCHGPEGRSKEPGVPNLAGQSEAYLALAIKEYQEGKRKNNYMNAMSDVLSLVEIKAIAAYYARQ